MKNKLITLLLLAVCMCLPMNAHAKSVPVSLSKTSGNLKVVYNMETKKTTYGTCKINVKTVKGIQIKKISYKTNNKKVAIVSSKGIIKAVAHGNAKIIVNVKYRKNKKVYSKKLLYGVKVKSLTKCSHSKATIINTVYATCTKSGYSGDTVCAACKKILAKGKTIPAKGHTKGKYHERIPSTCSSKGQAAYYECKNCKTKLDDKGKVLTNIILDYDPDAHVGGTYMEGVLLPTCTKLGYTGDVHCKSCKMIVTKGSNIAAKGHSPVKENDVAATCTKAGYTGATTCKTCKATLIARKTIPQIAHSWDAGKITQYTTYSSTGTKTYTCKSCGTHKTETIAKLIKVSTINVTWTSGSVTHTNQAYTFTKKSTADGRAFTIKTNANATRQDVTFKLVNKTDGTVTDVGTYLSINKDKTSTSKTSSSKCTIKCKKLPTDKNRTFYLKITANDGQGKSVYQKIIVNK